MARAAEPPDDSPDRSPWARLAGLAVAAVTLAVLVRALKGVAHIAVEELRYRARDPEALLKSVR